MRAILAITLLAAACGSDEGQDQFDARPTPDADPAAPDADPTAPDADPTVPDANPTVPDGAPSSVVEVTCPATPRVTVTMPGMYVFVPSDGNTDNQYTIAVDDVVRFQATATHDARSGTPGSPTSTFHADFNATTCFQFKVTGTFPFFCSLHGFTGTLIVE